VTIKLKSGFAIVRDVPMDIIVSGSRDGIISAVALNFLGRLKNKITAIPTAKKKLIINTLLYFINNLINSTTFSSFL